MANVQGNRKKAKKSLSEALAENFNAAQENPEVAPPPPEDALTEETNQQVVSNELVIKDSHAEVVSFNITPGACAKALARAGGFHRQALYIELAVNLAVFSASTTGADRPTKKVMLGIYTDAGYDTRVNGKHYKTVNRRINAAAKLFEIIGKAEVDAAMTGFRDGKAIEALGHHLVGKYEFTGINDVLELAGKPVKQTNTPEAIAARKEALAADDRAMSVNLDARRMERNAAKTTYVDTEDDATIVSAGVLSVVVPRSCKAEDVRAMANKLLAFADRMEEEEREANATPEEKRNQEMHS